MEKLEFSKKELNRFLLLGENNSYITDQNYPLIRAFKRKNLLAIFCTLRIKRETTTIKLGTYPNNSMEEIYIKFAVAQKIAKAGNNPNHVFVSNKIEENISNDKTLLSITNIFLKEKNLNTKYAKDFVNTLKKNLHEIFESPLKEFNKTYLSQKIDDLLLREKRGTAKNLLNYLSTLLNFSLKTRYFGEIDEILKILNHCSTLKDKYKKKFRNKKNLDKHEILKMINKLDNKQLMKVKKMLKEFN